MEYLQAVLITTVNNALGGKAKVETVAPWLWDKEELAKQKEDKMRRNVLNMIVAEKVH